MPGTLSIGAFVLGAVLLLVSLLSGGFKIFGAEVSGGTSTSARVIAFVLGLAFIGVGFATDGDKRSDTTAPPTAGAAGTPAAPAQVEVAPAPTAGATPAAPPARADVAAPAAAPQRARLRWAVDTAATANLLNNLGANDAQRAAAFVNAAVTQTDIFVIRVSFTNAGPGAVDFSPQRLQARAGGDALPIETLPRPGFLGAATVPPGQTLEGHLLLQAPMLAMGAGTVTLAYDSPGLEMRYER